MATNVSCPKCRSAILVLDPCTQDSKCHSCGFALSAVRSDEAVPDADEFNTVQPTVKQTVQTRFALLDKIGEGSFGSVWKAWDSELQRNVALKFPKVDNLPPQALAEFLRDAKAAAQMDHMYIVRIHDITQIDNLTAIVSELVVGLDLKDWLKKNKTSLTFRQTAELVIKIAEALQHAHERKIIHRDLKPGNVMLTDGMVPKVIDFGMARRETLDATFVSPGPPMGTPAYMPPEQARGEGNSADGRADIYSLGVMLFELLTGSVPFRGSSVADMISQQIQIEPPHPRQLNHQVPLDLETICLKCLRKEPAKRFQSAQEMAEDIRRWMDGKPILSRPVNQLESFRMLCRRNPRHTLAYGSAAGVSLLILGGAFLWISAARDSERAAKVKAMTLAEENLKLAKEAKQGKESAEAGRKMALSRLKDAHEAVDLWLTTIGEQLRFLPGLTREREQLLKLAEQDYAKFTAHESSDPNLELERGRVLLRLGQVRRALNLTSAAQESFEQARTLFEKLSKTSTSSSGTTETVAAARLAWCDSSIWLALLSQDAGKLDAADVDFKEAEERLEQLRAAGGDAMALDEALAIAIFNRGSLWLRKGDRARAQLMIERADKLFSGLHYANRGSRRLESLAAAGLELLGQSAREAGDLKSADKYTASAIEALKDLMQAENWNLDWQAQHARATLQRAAIMQQLGREKDELTSYESAIQDYETIAEVHPELATYQQELVLALIDAARLRLAQGHLSDAETLLAKTENPIQTLRLIDQQSPYIDQLVAHCDDVLGQIQVGSGQTKLGLEKIQHAVEILGQLATANMEFPEFRLSLALAQLHQAQALEEQDKQQADAAYAEACTTIQSVLDKGQPTHEQRYVAAYLSSARSDFLHRTVGEGSDAKIRTALAETESARAKELWKSVIQVASPAPDHLMEYGKFLTSHSDEKQRDPATALKLLDQLVSILPSSANLFQIRGLAQIRLKKFKEAEESLRQAIKNRGEEVARDGYCLSLALRGLQQTVEAQSNLEKATAWQEKHAPAHPELIRLRSEAISAAESP